MLTFERPMSPDNDLWFLDEEINESETWAEIYSRKSLKYSECGLKMMMKTVVNDGDEDEKFLGWKGGGSSRQRQRFNLLH